MQLTTNYIARLMPGLLLCVVVAAIATGLGALEAAFLGRAWLEGLGLAILVGTLVRTAWSPGQRWFAGIIFSAKTLLELAVLLLGASLSASTLAALGPFLIASVAAVVVVGIGASYGIGRLLGLPHRRAVLVACGNSICGNSAIAAVAPIIGADGEDVAASIGFTAVLGIFVVIGLPLLSPLLHMSSLQFGVLAGLTVYAVPQVLAAMAPVGPVAAHMGTLVKLVRVLMLGPVVLGLSLLTRHLSVQRDNTLPHGIADDSAGPRRLPLHRLMPWFIVGFLALAALRSANLIPPAILGPIAAIASLFTVIAMAALGLGTDLRVVTRAGGPVTATVTISLLILGAISLGVIRLLGVA